ncbi:MAG TPA: PaaI family thioesterase [Candidatus Binataceae bacterium]|nr:PaaI family thioesterase [Candidatus Binataceae bacterium]
MAAIREEFPAGIGTLLGLTLIREGVGRATVEFEAGARHSNPMGTLHGGVLCDIADAAMGIAYSSTLAAGETFTTIELKINFFRPVWNAKLRAEARMVRGGKTIGLVECNVLNDKNELVARASSTCMTLRGRRAEGRGLRREISAKAR